MAIAWYSSIYGFMVAQYKYHNSERSGAGVTQTEQQEEVLKAQFIFCFSGGGI